MLNKEQIFKEVKKTIEDCEDRCTELIDEGADYRSEILPTIESAYDKIKKCYEGWIKGDK